MTESTLERDTLHDGIHFTTGLHFFLYRGPEARVVIYSMTESTLQRDTFHDGIHFMLRSTSQQDYISFCTEGRRPESLFTPWLSPLYNGIHFMTGSTTWQDYISWRDYINFTIQFILVPRARGPNRYLLHKGFIWIYLISTRARGLSNRGPEVRDPGNAG